MTLKTPPALAEALWKDYADEMGRGGRLAPTFRDEFLSFVLPLAFEYHSAIFGPEGQTSTEATYIFLLQIVDRYPTLPKGWFDRFLAARQQAEMAPTAWGAAARVCYTQMSAKHRGKASAHYLEGFRLADRNSTMMENERVSLDRMPAVMTLYRGAFANSVEEAIAGLNWSHSHRNMMLGVFRRQQGFYGPRTTGGKDYILKAEVPKEIVLALLIAPAVPSGGDVRSQGYNGLIVDFERICRANVQCLPTSNLGVEIMRSMIPNVLALGTLGFTANQTRSAA